MYSAPIHSQNGGAAEACGRVPSGCFTLDTVPERERFGRWRQSISCIFDVEAGREIRTGRFHGQIHAHRLGKLLLAHTISMPQVWRRTERMIARDGMDHYMIQLFDAGAMVDESFGRETVLGRGGLAVFDLAQPSTTKTGDFSNLSLILPRELLAPILHRPDGQHMRVLHAKEPLVQLLREHMISLHRAAGDMNMAEANESNPATVALAAACLNGGAADASGSETSGSLIRTLGVRRLIEANLGAPGLSPDLIAEKAGLSPEAIGRMFAPAGGFDTYIRDRRLCRARVTMRRQRPSPQPATRDRDPDRRYEDWLQFLAV